MEVIEIYSVYIIHNDKNEKKYIGCTKNYNDRIKQHVRYLKGNYHHNSKLQDDFNSLNLALNFEILFQSENEEEAFKMEEELINIHKTKSIGYNLSDGGKFNRGYTQSLHAKEVASKVHSSKLGNLNSFYGKHHTDEAKEKIANSKRGKVGRKNTEDYKLNASLTSVKNKKIYYYGEEYRSITYASEITGNTRKTIRSRVNDINNKEAYFIE